MEDLYVVTGASGHLGNVMARTLVQHGCCVWVFLFTGENNVVEGVKRVFHGDVCEKNSLDVVFQAAGDQNIIFIHCAGIVSIKSRYFQHLHDVNVGGTKNVVDLCLKYKVKKLIYVSSVHAIPENPPGSEVTETEEFDPNKVVGHYAKTKAEATKYVLDARANGLNVHVIHPSGIIGPYDYGNGHMTTMIMDYCNNRLWAGMSGGYDFVDVRDVAEGIWHSCNLGRPGACYIMSNQYYTIKEIFNVMYEVTGKKKIRYFLPLWFVKLTAPFSELYYRVLHQSPLYTAYSIYTLMANNRYSHQKATRELGYKPRDIAETLKDTVQWLKEAGRIK
ncbi:NAD-dependent epimerase/dehydratase family protein [Alkalibacter rhizosphaerae]|uniref:NAD-dependent epimerase/dehydratase family protein n=1 Tax=Alkalibacter rhizosphaerae TaxID=2815577 RepID=A0A974XGY5_9FIRM|nr:NAD-dependent epimerase/dehydratase family protein [Alkalibacter rhizosphaerae]QSX08520.1 NAD-dependent epimerase/dehydratase family protein [Alkalibacter rhizosphaerae]